MISRGQLDEPYHRVSRSGTFGWVAGSHQAPVAELEVRGEAAYRCSTDVVVGDVAAGPGKEVEQPCSQLYEKSVSE